MNDKISCLTSLLRAASRDPREGKDLLLVHMDWLGKHHASLPCELACGLLEAISQMEGPTDEIRKASRGLLATVMKSWRKLGWNERSWSLASLGKLLQAGTLDATDLSSHGKLNSRALLRDAKRYANQTPNDPSQDVLLSACKRGALEAVAGKVRQPCGDGRKKPSL